MNTQRHSHISLGTLSAASVLTLYFLGLAGVAAMVFMRYGAQMVRSISLGFFPTPWLYEMWAEFFPTAMLLSAAFVAITAIVWLESRVSEWLHHRTHHAHDGRLAYQTQPISRGRLTGRDRLVHR